MKKITAIFICAMMLFSAFVLASCGETPATTEATTAATTASEATTEATTSATTAATTEATTAATTEAATDATTEATTEAATEATTEATPEATTEATTAWEPPIDPEKKEVKILAIGNSFSQDTTQYVYSIFKNAGYEKVYIANMYIGGCSLDTHWANIKADAASYDYEYNDHGVWQTQKNKSISFALAQKDWDVITVQQVSQDSGRKETFGNLQNIVNYIKDACPNAKICWNMTWAYPQSSGSGNFALYGKDQMTMYNAIVDAAQSFVLNSEEVYGIDGVIPAGTAVQNVRTSYIGDTLNRDSIHLDYNMGRYIAGLMWFKYISGKDISDITFTPDEITASALDVIKECVNNAFDHPFEVTKSQYAKAVPTAREYDAKDLEILANLGLDPEKYFALDLGEMASAYYNSGKGASLYKTESNSPNFYATAIFTKSEIPSGSYIVLADGYKYRPEGWKQSGTTSSSSRPSEESTAVVRVNNSWWSSWNYRAFNVSSKTSGTTMTESDFGALRIYVPYVSDDELDRITLESLGLDPAAYTKIDLGEKVGVYYDSTTGSISSFKAEGSADYYCTKLMQKVTLPVGSIIVLTEGYKYRPEGWVDINVKNEADARPAETTESVVVIDEAWWGEFTLRAFNVSAGEPKEMTSNEFGALKIFVPKS